MDAKQTGEHELTLEWESSASNDMVADSALALITGIDKSPASAKRKHIPWSPLHSSCRAHGIFLVFRVYTHTSRVVSGDLKICVAMTAYPSADVQQSFQSCFLFVSAQ